MEWKISNDVLMRVQTELKEASPPSSISVFVLDDLRISLNYTCTHECTSIVVVKTLKRRSDLIV